MGNTAELLLEDILSQSQLLNIQKSDLPTTGIPLPRMVDPNPPNMTGRSEELILVPEDERDKSISIGLAYEVVILSGTMFK